eukprot:3066811-Pleurochrysis_carterae.AAC.1
MANVGGGCEQVPPLHSGGGGALQVAGLQHVRRDRGVRGRRDAAGLLLRAHLGHGALPLRRLVLAADDR